MSICVSESLQSRRLLDEICRLSDERLAQDVAEAETAIQFAMAIEAGDPDATPEWCGTVADYDTGRKLGKSVGTPGYPLRVRSVAECLDSGLDYTGGPDMGDVLRVLSLAMKSADPVVSTAARKLVQRAAQKFAEHNTQEVDA